MLSVTGQCGAGLLRGPDIHRLASRALLLCSTLRVQAAVSLAQVVVLICVLQIAGIVESSFGGF